MWCVHMVHARYRCTVCVPGTGIFEFKIHVKTKITCVCVFVLQASSAKSAVGWLHPITDTSRCAFV
jgi:hypothetical protein